MDLYNRRVAILWDQPSRWFEGVLKRTAKNGKTLIVYDYDGEEIWHNLQYEVSEGRLRWLDIKASIVPLCLPCTSKRTGWLIDERKDRSACEFRVRWFGCSPADDTWEPEAKVPRDLINQLRWARSALAEGLRRMHASQEEAPREAADGVRLRPPILAALPDEGEIAQQQQQQPQQPQQQQEEEEEEAQAEGREEDEDEQAEDPGALHAAPRSAMISCPTCSQKLKVRFDPPFRAACTSFHARCVCGVKLALSLPPPRSSPTHMLPPLYTTLGTTLDTQGAPRGPSPPMTVEEYTRLVQEHTRSLETYREALITHNNTVLALETGYNSQCTAWRQRWGCESAESGSAERGLRSGGCRGEGSSSQRGSEDGELWPQPPLCRPILPEYPPPPKCPPPPPPLPQAAHPQAAAPPAPPARTSKAPVPASQPAPQRPPREQPSPQPPPPSRSASTQAALELALSLPLLREASPPSPEPLQEDPHAAAPAAARHVATSAAATTSVATPTGRHESALPFARVSFTLAGVHASRLPRMRGCFLMSPFLMSPGPQESGQLATDSQAWSRGGSAPPAPSSSGGPEAPISGRLRAKPLVPRNQREERLMFAQAISESVSAAPSSVSRADEVEGETRGESNGAAASGAAAAASGAAAAASGAAATVGANRVSDDRKRTLQESDETRRGRKRRAAQQPSTDSLERVDSDSRTSLGNESAVEAAADGALEAEGAPRLLGALPTGASSTGVLSTSTLSAPAPLSAPSTAPAQPPRAVSHMEAAAAAAERARAAAAAALAAARSEGSDEADCGEGEEEDDDGNDDSRSTTSGSHSGQRSRYGQRRREAQRREEQRRDGQRRERCLLFGCKTKLLRCSGVKVVGSPVGCAKNGHVLCAPCLDRWFSAQNSLREDSGLLPLTRRSCPVCKTELRGAGGEVRCDARQYFMGLQKVEWSWQGSAGYDETILRRTPS